GDAGVEVAVEAEIPDRAGVGAALALLQFIDDVHGAHLRAAADGTGGEGGAHDIVGVAVRAQAAIDIADDVHDMAVALDDHEVADAHRAELGDAADIVAGEIDEHD